MQFKSAGASAKYHATGFECVNDLSTCSGCVFDLCHCSGCAVYFC